MPQQCPGDDVFIPYLRGTLPMAESDTLGDHLLQCGACLNRLSELEKQDSFFAVALQSPAHTDESMSRRDDLDGLKDRLKAMAMLSGNPTPEVESGGPRTKAFTQDLASADGSAEEQSFGILQRIAGANGAVRSPEPVRKIPPSIGRFKVQRFLGEGGFGAVYQAWDPQLDRLVAIKVAKLGRSDSEQRIKRFLREAKSAAGLRHPHIVPVHEFGEVGDDFYIVSEFVPGRTLQDALREQKLNSLTPDLGRAARIVRQLAEALAYAHSQRIVHRDVKPANVILDDKDEPMLLDFGLATRTEDAEKLTHAGMVLGTPLYMAPEQARGTGTEALPASDQYSLGVVLFEMITGAPPFSGVPELVMLRKLEDEPPRPSKLNPMVSRDLETICLKCLERTPERRYADCRALAEDLRRLLEGEPILARPLGTLERLTRWCRRKPAAAGLWGVSIVAILVTLGLSFFYTFRLADARGKTAIVELEKEKIDQQKRAAEELALTQQYFANLMEARERISQTELGWPSSSLTLIEKAASLATAARKPADLRSATVACLAGFELRPTSKICENINTSVLAFHPNGHQLAVGEYRTFGLNLFTLRVRLLEFPSGKLIREMTYPADTLAFPTVPDGSRSIAWSPDGRWLAVGSRHGKVHVWDTHKTAEPTTLDTGGLENGQLAFSPDSAVLYTTSNRSDQAGTIRRWQIGDEIKESASKALGRIGGLAVPKSNRHLIVLVAGKLTILEAESLAIRKPTASQKTAIQSFGGMTMIAGDRAILAERQGRIEWINSTSFASLHTFRAPRDEALASQGVRDFRASSDGRVLLTHSFGTKDLHFWDAVTGDHLANWPYLDGEGYAEFDPTGRWVVVSTKNAVQILEIVRRQEYRTMCSLSIPFAAVAIANNGETLASVTHLRGKTASLRLATWDLRENGKPLPTFERGTGFDGDGLLSAVRFHPRHAEFAAASSFASIVEVVDPSTKSVVWSEKLSKPRDIAYTPDGEQLWVAHAEDLFVAVGRDEKKHTYKWHNLLATINNVGSSTAVAASTDWAALGNSEGYLYLFSTKLPEKSGAISPLWTKSLGNRLEIHTVAISPDQEWILAGDQAGHLYRVNRATREVLKRTPHRQGITSIHYLANDLFVTSSRDGTIRFWRWSQDYTEELFRMTVGVAVLRLDRDGKTLAALVEQERGVRLWNLESLWTRFAAINVPIDRPSSWGDIKK